MWYVSGMSAVLSMLPLFGFMGAVVGLTTMLSRRTKQDDERWTLDRRKRDRRTVASLGLPPRETGERRVGERRRATTAVERN
jgi:hypothetical protein